jgi:hypothetical protein
MTLALAFSTVSSMDHALLSTGKPFSSFIFFFFSSLFDLYLLWMFVDLSHDPFGLQGRRPSLSVLRGSVSDLVKVLDGSC